METEKSRPKSIARTVQRVRANAADLVALVELVAVTDVRSVHSVRSPSNLTPDSDGAGTESVFKRNVPAPVFYGRSAEQRPIRKGLRRFDRFTFP
jgi:hypothetical protein